MMWKETGVFYWQEKIGLDRIVKESIKELLNIQMRVIKNLEL